MASQPVATAIKTLHVDCLKLLLEHKSAKSSRDVRDYSTLMLAIANGEMAAIEILLNYGEDVSYVTPRTRESALFLACFQGESWLDTIKLLCEKATKLDLEPNENEKAAIHWACGSKSPEIVEVVVSKGIDVNRLDSKGKTGLYYLLDACREENVIRILEILVRNGLNLGPPNLSIMHDFATAIQKPY
jgi:ankyrin repeat protein